mmetsp:Transcript_27748/g.69767  ORF Transcript_27748/g.69767 Transcript_27748/m.69767 type:complete len:463 (-) Transcript_27748:27-1415(-)
MTPCRSFKHPKLGCFGFIQTLVRQPLGVLFEILLGLLQEIRIGKVVNAGTCQNLHGSMQTLSANAHAMASDTSPMMRRDSQWPGGVHEAHGRDVPRNITHVGGSAHLDSGGNGEDRGGHSFFLLPNRFLDLLRVVLFLIGPSQGELFFNNGHHMLGHGVIWDTVVDSTQIGHLALGLGSQGGAFRNVLDPIDMFSDILGGRIAVAEEDPGVVRNDIHCRASLLDYVVHPRRGEDVLSHHIRGHEKDLGGLERASALPRGHACVGGFTVELDPQVDRRGRVEVQARGDGTGVVVEANVERFEGACIRHIILSVEHFLRRASEYSQRPGHFVLLHVLFQSDCRADARGADEIMPATVARSVPRGAGSLLRFEVVAQARKRVELAEESQYGRARSVGGDPGGFAASDASIADFETHLLKGFLFDGRGLELSVAKLGKAPHLGRNVPDRLFELLVDDGIDLFMGGR